MVTSAIDVSGVSKSFGETRVLDDLSFTVDQGEVYGLLGQNGAGKTTTINLLTGIVAPDDGTLTVLDYTPAETPIDVRANVGILPEKESPPSFLTPREYFAFIADVRGIDRETVTERLGKWAKRLSLMEHLDVLCKDLSRGQAQKVMLVQAFLHEPSLVIIDEPLANLDPLMQDAVKDFIREYHAAGNTIVISTHHLEIAEELCTRVGIIHDGTLATEQTPGEGETLHDTFRRIVAAPDQ